MVNIPVIHQDVTASQSEPAWLQTWSGLCNCTALMQLLHNCSKLILKAGRLLVSAVTRLQLLITASSYKSKGTLIPMLTKLFSTCMLAQNMYKQ